MGIKTIDDFGILSSKLQRWWFSVFLEVYCSFWKRQLAGSNHNSRQPIRFFFLCIIAFQLYSLIMQRPRLLPHWHWGLTPFMGMADHLHRLASLAEILFPSLPMIKAIYQPYSRWDGVLFLRLVPKIQVKFFFLADQLINIFSFAPPAPVEVFETTELPRLHGA